MTEYELDKGVWKKTAVTIDNDGMKVLTGIHV